MTISMDGQQPTLNKAITLIWFASLTPKARWWASMTAAFACLLSPLAAHSQLFLSPQGQKYERSNTSIDFENIRCSSSGGSTPSASLSFGVDPLAVNEFNDSFRPSNRTPFLGIASINIPLASTNQNFDCQELHDEALKQARLNSLRQLVDEQIISEEQYIFAVKEIYKDLLDKQDNFQTDNAENFSDFSEAQTRKGAVIIQ